MGVLPALPALTAAYHPGHCPAQLTIGDGWHLAESLDALLPCRLGLVVRQALVEGHEFLEGVGPVLADSGVTSNRQDLSCKARKATRQ